MAGREDNVYPTFLETPLTFRILPCAPKLSQTAFTVTALTIINMQQTPELELTDLPWRERICKHDSTKFMKFIQSTPTHGVVHIFTGKSVIRRLFWLLILLAAGGYCFYNILDRIQFLLSNPTTTSTTVVRQETLAFPAVTICNLNIVKRSYLEELGSAGVNISDLLDVDLTCSSCNQSNINVDAEGLNLTRITLEGGHQVEDLILSCYFNGKKCSIDNFTPVLTRLGVCYSFNSGPANISTLTGTGPRFGLQLVVDIEQEEYAATLNADAGIALIVHSQGEPGEPTDAGITIPPGHAARIGLRKKIVRDQSKTSMCRQAHSNDFNFLPDIYEYSMSACLVDKYFTSVAEHCGCIDSSVPARPRRGWLSTLSDCGVAQLCCTFCVFATAPRSGCPSACQYTTYTTTVSYSSFPSEYAIQNYYNFSRELIQQNLLSVSVFFQDFNVEEQTTTDAYGLTALLSDIGGQLGLFLGASVVSVLEFVLWVLDELKDRCVGVNDRKLLRWLRRRILQCKRWEREAKAQLESIELELGRTQD